MIPEAYGTLNMRVCRKYDPLGRTSYLIEVQDGGEVQSLLVDPDTARDIIRGLATVIT